MFELNCLEKERLAVEDNRENPKEEEIIPQFILRRSKQTLTV